MDLYFQGRAWSNKGPTPEYMAQARGFFERALALDPENIEALVGMASVDATIGSALLTDDRAARLAAAEAALIKALSLAPQHAWAHLFLGVVQIFTNRAAQGIAECERALALDRNLADAHAFIGLGQVFYLVAARKPKPMSTRRSASLLAIPTPTVGCCIVGLAKLQLNADAEAVAWLRRSIEANRNYPIAHFYLAAALALLGAAGRGEGRRAGGTCAQSRASPSAASAPAHRATIRLTLPDASASMRACAWPGCLRGDVAVGSIASFCRSAHDFRSSLGSGHRHDRSACLEGASFGLTHRSKPDNPATALLLFP